MANEVPISKSVVWDMFCIVFCHESLNLEDFVVLLVHLTCITKPEISVCQFIF